MPLDPLSDLNDVLNSAFSALGARTSGGQPAPPVGPSVAQQMQTAPERAGNMLMSALGPLGDAGRQVGEMMRTRSVDPRDLPLLAGNVLMGTMAPGGAEGGAAAHGTQSLEDIVAALARGVGRGEAHGTVSNADVPQPSSLGYYGKSMWNPTVEMHYKNVGGTYAGKTQGGYSYSSAADKDFLSSANDYFIHDENGSKIGSMSYIPEEMTENSSTPAHWFMNLRNAPDLADKNYTAEELPTALEHAKLWNEQGLAQKMPGLSDEELNAQLAKNPGASIFDIAGTKAPAGPATYKGYALHESGEPGDYFVHDSDGNEAAQVTKMENGKYKIELNNGANVLANSPLDALQKVQSIRSSSNFTPPVAKPEMDLSEHLGPLNWESMTHSYGPASFEDIQAREQARQLGFNIDNPLFKGGALKDYPENLYIPNKSYERGLFFSDNPTVANSYARYGASPLEYVARAERPMTVDWPSATGQSDYQESHMHALIEAARAKGADLLHIGNISDIGGKQDQYVVLDPSIVRAPSAAFDPARLKEAAPLAGLAGLSAGGLFFDENGNMKVAQ